jgi:hypothetical protein
MLLHVFFITIYMCEIAKRYSRGRKIEREKREIESEREKESERERKGEREGEIL